MIASRRFTLVGLFLIACSGASATAPTDIAPSDGSDDGSPADPSLPPPPPDVRPSADAAPPTPHRDARADVGADADAGAAATLPPLPLRTDGRWIVDATGKRFKLASVNWYGAEEKDYVVAGLDKVKVDDLANAIRKQGFNSVRIPWSNEMYELDPVVDPARVAANPDLAGKHAMAIFDRVIAALANAGLVVILANHISAADWCCSDTDGNGLWYTQAYPESSWLADWKGMALRYTSQPAVVGADLRNELRPANGNAPTWGGSDPSLDWHAAAERGGNSVLGANPNLLVMVEGLSYSADFTHAYNLPVQLALPHRLVYAPHDYSFFHPTGADYASLKKTLGDSWGFLLIQGKAFTAPVWVGEFGTCHGGDACVDATSGDGLWFKSFRQYLADADVDWAYWALNGTQATGRSRTLGAEETYGVLNPSWTAPALPSLTNALAAMQPATQGP